MACMNRHRHRSMLIYAREKGKGRAVRAARDIHERLEGLGEVVVDLLYEGIE